jgi:hypothetical protein
VAANFAGLAFAVAILRVLAVVAAAARPPRAGVAAALRPAVAPRVAGLADATARAVLRAGAFAGATARFGAAAALAPRVAFAAPRTGFAGVFAAVAFVARPVGVLRDAVPRPAAPPRAPRVGVRMASGCAPGWPPVSSLLIP